MKKIFQAVIALGLAASMLCAPMIAKAAPAAAANITKSCKLVPSSNAGSIKKATDGRLDTVWKGTARAGQYIDITIGGGAKPGGLYFRWDAPPPAWTLYVMDANGLMAEAVTGGGNGYLTDYVALPEQFHKYSKLRLASEDGKKGFAIAELSVYGEGAAPFYAPTWQPFTGRVDVMVFSAHPDDDVLYLGAVIPTYAQQGKSAVTVYMTYGKPLRRFEGMEGAWTAGERIYPVMGTFPDTYSPHDIGPLKRSWPEKKAAAFIVEQIRKYKPSVIVTHDIKGEYGHGAHQWTSALVQQAFERSGDPAYYPESAQKYGTWNPAKLYLHIYKNNKLTINTRAPLSLFGGRTAFDVAKQGYTRHISQHVWSFAVADSGVYSIRNFGLFATRVGQDTGHNDMFESVTEDKMKELNPQYSPAVVDTVALSAAITRAEAAKQDGYTAESWVAANLAEGITQAKAVLAGGAAGQADVDTATAVLDAAMSKLVPAAPVLTGITITAPPQKLVYAVGEALDTTGLVVTGTYSDGSTAALNVAAADVKGFDSATAAASQTLTVASGGKTATYTVEIKAGQTMDAQGYLFQLLSWLKFLS